MANVIKGSDIRLAFGVDGLGAGKHLEDDDIEVSVVFFIKDNKSAGTVEVEKTNMHFDEVGDIASMVVSTETLGLGRLMAEATVTYTDEDTSEEVTEVFSPFFESSITLIENA